MGLTPKQERFCHAYIETSNASEAYRQAYAASRMKPATINVKACVLLAGGKVAARVAELRDSIIVKVHGVTVASLLLELEEARQVGKERGQASSMVAATLGKARLAGIDDGTDDDANSTPQRVEVTVTDARKPSADA